MGTVLVVEDDRGCCLTLAALIRRAGHRVRSCYSAHEALAELLTTSPDATRPDLVIVDFAMPEMDGIELLRRMRADARTQHTPVIFFSAVSDERVIARATSLGASEYWVKARFDFAELPRRVNRYVPTAQEQDLATTAPAPPASPAARPAATSTTSMAAGAASPAEVQPAVPATLPAIHPAIVPPAASSIPPAAMQ